jgi:HEXXH motif-containing protein
VYLPTLGRMRVGDGTSAVIKTTGGVFTIESGGRRFDQNDVNWEPVRTLRAPGITLLFDDIDPHRGCYSVPARERLTPSDWEIWQKTFEAAWSLLQEKDPGQAAAIRAGLRVITPIAGEPGRFGVARHAYGAVALPECVDPETLARLLAGGFASGQFAALRDMIDFSRNARAADELQDCYARLVTASFLEPGAEGAELLSLLQIMEGWAEDTFSGVGRRFLEGMKSAALTRLAVLDI